MRKHFLPFTLTFLLCMSAFASVDRAHAQEGNTEDLMRFLDLISEQVGEARPDLGDNLFDIGNSTGSIDSILNQIELGQETVEEFETGGISIGMFPQFPEAGQQVTFSVSGYGVNLNESLYTWYINGTLVSTGYGETEIRHRLGDVGVATRVEVTIYEPGGGAIERVLTVVPNQMDILWEAIDSYTPPFYRGKALPSYDSVIKFTTVSTLFDGNGNRVDPESLVYTWEKNGQRRDFADYSGYGGNTAYMLGDFMRKSHRVSVEAMSSTLGIRAAERVSVTLRDPNVVIYEKHPLSGIVYERALGSETAVSDSVRLVAEPFYMDQRNLLDIEYEWEVNNRPIDNQEAAGRGEILLVTDGDQQGESRVYVRAENPSKLLQNADQALRINIE